MPCAGTPEQSSPNEALSIIDTPITLKERVQAWEMAHADLRRSDKRSFKRKAEQFRANVILADAKPLHLAREQMLELGLARQKLPACPDVSAYVHRRCPMPPSVRCVRAVAWLGS